jgi:hypothetical protein
MVVPDAVLLGPQNVVFILEFKWGRDGLKVYNHRFPDNVLYVSKVNLNEISLFCEKKTDGYMQI